MTRPSSLEPTQIRAPAQPAGSSRPSTPTSARSMAAGAPDGATSFTWRSWPIVDEAARSWLLIAALIAIAVVCGWTVGNALAGVLVAVVLAYSVRQLWLSATYEISDYGIERRCLGRSQRIPWPRVSAAEAHRSGVALQIASNANSVGNARMMFVSWGNCRESVLAAIERVRNT